MFRKINNAQMSEPDYGFWAISRGYREQTPHRATLVSIDSNILDKKILAHRMYQISAKEMSFPQFIGSIQMAHEIYSVTVPHDDAGTIEQLAKAGISAYVRTRKMDVHGNLLVPKKLYRDEIEPFFPLIQAAATTAEDNYFGVSII